MSLYRVLTTSNRKPPLRRSDSRLDNTMFNPFYSRIRGLNLSQRGSGCYSPLGVVVVDGVAVPVAAGGGVTLTVAMRNSQLSPS